MSQRPPPIHPQLPQRPGGVEPAAAADLLDECPTVTYRHPSPARRRVGGATVRKGSTQILTSDVLRPIVRCTVRPAPTRPERLVPAAPTDAIRPAPTPQAPRPRWTLEHKLLAANILLGLIVLVEFFVL